MSAVGGPQFGGAGKERFRGGSTGVPRTPDTAVSASPSSVPSRDSGKTRAARVRVGSVASSVPDREHLAPSLPLRRSAAGASIEPKANQSGESATVDVPRSAPTAGGKEPPLPPPPHDRPTAGGESEEPSPAREVLAKHHPIAALIKIETPPDAEPVDPRLAVKNDAYFTVLNSGDREAYDKMIDPDADMTGSFPEGPNFPPLEEGEKHSDHLWKIREQIDADMEFTGIKGTELPKEEAAALLGVDPDSGNFVGTDFHTYHVFKGTIPGGPPAGAPFIVKVKDAIQFGTDGRVILRRATSRPLSPDEVRAKLAEDQQ